MLDVRSNEEQIARAAQAVAQEALEAILMQRRSVEEAIESNLSACRQAFDGQVKSGTIAQLQSALRELRAQLETLEPEVAPPPPPGPQARRDMFPDIDEINSTLDTPDSAKPKPKRTPRPAADKDKGREPRGGFSRGFSIVVLLVAIAFGLYVFAPRIVELFPGLTDTMVAYVDLVNRLFGWIEGLMQGVVDKLEDAAGEG